MCIHAQVKWRSEIRCIRCIHVTFDNDVCYFSYYCKQCFHCIYSFPRWGDLSTINVSTHQFGAFFICVKSDQWATGSYSGKLRHEISAKPRFQRLDTRFLAPSHGKGYTRGFVLRLGKDTSRRQLSLSPR